MKNLVCIFFLLIVANSNSQIIKLNYYPEHSGNVTLEAYNIAKTELKSIYDQIEKAEVKAFIYVDYFNIGTTYMRMGQEKDIVLPFFLKVKELNPSFLCAIHKMVKDDNAFENPNAKDPYKVYFGSDFNVLFAGCQAESKATDNTPYWRTIKDRIDVSLYNEDLIDEIIALMDKDQFYRGVSSSHYLKNREAQDKLDSEVRMRLSKIFDNYGYPTETLVSKEFRNKGCLLLEHSGDIEAYDKYFPIVEEAYLKGQVDAPYFKMLIDRISFRKNGYQIFGSHRGTPFAPEKVVTNYKEKYNL